MLAWWVWMAIGLVLLIVELTSGTMFLMWLACGAFLAGGAALVMPAVWWVPWVVFSAASVLLIAATRPWARSMQAAGGQRSNVDDLIDREAIVLVSIDPANNTGRVRVGSDEWRARCDQPVEEGGRVVVNAVQGTTLVVTPLEG